MATTYDIRTEYSHPGNRRLTRLKIDIFGKPFDIYIALVRMYHAETHLQYSVYHADRIIACDSLFKHPSVRDATRLGADFLSKLFHTENFYFTDAYPEQCTQLGEALKAATQHHITKEKPS